MKMKKFDLRFRRMTAIRCLLFAWILSLFCGCEKKAEVYHTLSQLAYDESEDDNPVVYLRDDNDNSTYAPYLVLTSDYNGNVLLLRKNLLPEEMPYKEHDWGWSGEYGSYYEESTIDAYLNTEFLDSLSSVTRECIADSTIEVTDMEYYDEWNYKTHMISRKVFLLSSTELGVLGMESVTAKEGLPLSYFDGKMYDRKVAGFADGRKIPYWMRTPDLWETCLVLTIGVTAIGVGSAEVYGGIRPAFCMGKQTAVRLSSDIVQGETVYVIEEQDIEI